MKPMQEEAGEDPREEAMETPEQEAAEMDENGMVVPKNALHNEMFNYQQVHKDRHGY